MSPSGKLTKFDADYYYDPKAARLRLVTRFQMDRLSKVLPNRLHAIFIYSLDGGQSTQSPTA